MLVERKRLNDAGPPALNDAGPPALTGHMVMVMQRHIYMRYENIKSRLIHTCECLSVIIFPRKIKKKKP